MIEAELRRAAFGDRPSAPISRVPYGMSIRTWLTAVVLGARGEYAAAATLLAPLRRCEDDLLAALAGATFAAHRRQLGGHAVARGIDAAALVRAERAVRTGTGHTGHAHPDGADPDGVDPTGALVDALLGLAADNLALGRLSAARRLIGRAVDAGPGWRGEVRAGWVRAEVELMAGDVDAARPAAERALTIAEEHGAVRHAVKSKLVLAAALTASGGDRERARGLVAEAVAVADTACLRSLSWPAGLLAADLHPDESDELRAEVTFQLYSLLRRSDPQARRLARRSAWVPG